MIAIPSLSEISQQIVEFTKAEFHKINWKEAGAVASIICISVVAISCFSHLRNSFLSDPVFSTLAYGSVIVLCAMSIAALINHVTIPEIYRLAVSLIIQKIQI